MTNRASKVFGLLTQTEKYHRIFKVSLLISSSPSFLAKLENAHAGGYPHRTIIAHPFFLKLL